jgi:hypothetical protein
MTGKTPSTALEALTSEMLGDVGRLHDSLEQIKRDVPAMTKQIEEFLPKLANGLNSPTMERFIAASISEIFIAARRAREEAKQDMQSAVATAVSEGWVSVRKRGDWLFKHAADEFTVNIGGASAKAAEEARASIAPLLKGLSDEIANLRRQRFRERWLMCAFACTCTGAITGVAAVLLLMDLAR